MKPLYTDKSFKKFISFCRGILQTTFVLRLPIVSFIIITCCIPVKITAQVNSDSSQTSKVGLFPKKEESELYRISVAGFYRFYGTQTRNSLPYLLSTTGGQTVPQNQLFIGDDTQLPTLQLNVSGRPTLKTSWAFDIYTYQYLNGNLDEAYGRQVADSLRPSTQDPLSGTRLASSLILNLGINFTGTHETQFGTFTVRTGGIQWHYISELTMGSFRGYNRFTLFERNPWDPVTNSVSTRYDKYFNEGAVDQDMRWGNKAFKGFALDATELPLHLGAKLLVGKTELNGGFSPTPNVSYGGRIFKEKDAGKFYAINTMNSITYSDSLVTEKVGFNEITFEVKETIFDFGFHLEAGAAQYFSPTHSEGWGELISATIMTPAKKSIPTFSLHGFRINPDVINNNSIFLNSGVTEYITNEIPAGSIGSNAVLRPTGSAMQRMGQMSNNRQGIDLNIEQIWKSFSVNVGFAMTGEIEAISNTITYTHPISGLTRARFWRFAFPSDVGPYDRYSVIYRDVYETVNLTDDSSGVAVNKKYFSVFEPQLKYKTKLFNRALYLFYLGYYSSAQRDWSAIPVLDEEAYIRQYASEFEVYYNITDGLVLSGYLGYERTLGNYLTDIDEETRRPRNQIGNGYGAGLDIDLGRNAILYVRNKWSKFIDTSFKEDAFRNQETIVELKIFF
ncbi:MAG: hypothetical protein ACKVPJ_09990 [Chitinophagales bacterium]